MSRARASRALCLILLSTAGCKLKPELGISITFPDPETIAKTTGIVITAVEPFAPSQDAMMSRVLVQCGEIGVFPPTAKFSRDGSDVMGLDHVLLNREFHKYPLGDSWSLDIPALSTGVDVNPWRAVLVHLEARGPAATYDQGLTQEEDKTLLEGCFCVRLDPKASSPNADLDAKVKSLCVAADAGKNAAPTTGGATTMPVTGLIDVPLHAVVPSEFRLVPSGVKTLTAPATGRFAAEPGVKIDTTRCDEQPNGQACFHCIDARCAELDDRRNVPVVVEVEGLDVPSSNPDRINSPVSLVVLTDKTGKAVPEVNLKGCVDKFTLRAYIAGRKSEPVEFTVRCVQPVQFCEAPDANNCDPTATRNLTAHKLQNGDKVVGLTNIPGDHGPDRLAVLLGATTSGRPPTVVVYAPDGDHLSVRAQIQLPGEEARAIKGFWAKDGDAASRGDPRLAVITTTQSAAMGTMPGRRVPKIHLYHWDEVSSMLVEDQKFSGDCPTCSCTEPEACDSCNTTPNAPPCALPAGLRADTFFAVTAADVDGDGFNNLAFGPVTDTIETTYFSVGRNGSRSPSLFGGCSCSKFGKALSAFEMLRLGGPGDAMVMEEKNVNLIVGDLTGAFVRYATGPTPDGPSCIGDTDTSCPAGTTCTRHCSAKPGTGATWRCLEDCSGGAMCRTSAMRPACITTSTATPGHMAVPHSYCGGPKLVCGEPRSVWGFVNVHNVTKGKFAEGIFEDAVAVGSGSPVPGVEGTPKLRIIFGDRVDLTDIMHAPQDVQNRSYLDLLPRPFEKRSLPQKPRTVGVGDFNGDGMDDLAVLFTGSASEIHVWLGGKNRGAGEISKGPVLDCSTLCMPDGRCTTLEKFAVGDFDGDHKDEIVAVCVPESEAGAAVPILRWYKPGSTSETP